MEKLKYDAVSLYERYPFPGPGVEYTVPSVTHILTYLQEREEDFNGFEGIDILDAGCGTGATSVSVSTFLPNANVHGVDLSGPSVKLATEQAAQFGITNATFAEADLRTLDLGRKFDLIFCTGVLHIMDQPELALERLAAHVKPEGRIMLWLYGTHGRAQLRANQQSLLTLLGGVHDLQQRVELTKELLRDSALRKHLECYFSTASGEVDGHWDRSVNWILEHDAWLVDQFLNPYERTYTMPEIHALLDTAGLEVDEWAGVERSQFKEIVKSKQLIDLYEALDHGKQREALDGLLKPHSYTIAARLRSA